MNLESKREVSGPAVGLLLVALGVVALLSQAGLFRSLGGILGALILGGAGIYLIRRYGSGTRELWALCGGFALLGLALAALPGPLSGTAFLGLTGIGFALAYADDRRRWWAIIPAGVLLTLALIAGLDRLAPPLSGGAVLLLGLAATFWYLYRQPRRPWRWALYPAAALALLGLLTLSLLAAWLLPLALIAAGLYLFRWRQDGRVVWRAAAEMLARNLERLALALARQLERLAAAVDRAVRTEPAGSDGDPAPSTPVTESAGASDGGPGRRDGEG